MKTLFPSFTTSRGRESPDIKNPLMAFFTGGGENAPKIPKSSPMDLVKILSDVGWDMDSRLYLGFGRQRTSWELKKNE